jgi:hypothetical protein
MLVQGGQGPDQLECLVQYERPSARLFSAVSVINYTPQDVRRLADSSKSADL